MAVAQFSQGESTWLESHFGIGKLNIGQIFFDEFQHSFKLVKFYLHVL